MAGTERTNDRADDDTARYPAKRRQAEDRTDGRKVEIESISKRRKPRNVGGNHCAVNKELHCYGHKRSLVTNERCELLVINVRRGTLAHILTLDQVVISRIEINSGGIGFDLAELWPCLQEVGHRTKKYPQQNGDRPILSVELGEFPRCFGVLARIEKCVDEHRQWNREKQKEKKSLHCAH